jgi:hypothetical protein
MPAKVRCHFTKYTEEAWRDRNGEIIVSSSFERLGGKQVEFDKGSPAVSITMNILPASTESSLKRFSDLMDCVNDRPLWGWKPRMVKFSDITYELMYYGNYSILSATLDFEIKTRRITQDNQTDVVSGHDRDVLDAGWKIRTLGTDGTKPEHYQSNKNPADKDRSMIFYGDPNNDATRGYAWKYAGQKKDTMNKIRVEYYNEANLFTLGIPVDIDNPVGRSSGSEGEPPPP